MSKFTDRIDMRFSYTPAASTNVAATIRRERARLKAVAEAEAKEKVEAAARQAAHDAEAMVKVRKIKGAP